MKNAQSHWSLGKYKSNPWGDTTSHSLGWLLSKEKWKITNVGEDVEKLEPWYVAGGNV